jgi:hypothetical protein
MISRTFSLIRDVVVMHVAPNVVGVILKGYETIYFGMYGIFKGGRVSA